VTDEEAIIEEAIDNLMEAAQRIRATQNRLWSANLDDHPNYRNLRHRLSSALAITEAAFMRLGAGQRGPRDLNVGPAYRGGVAKGNRPPEPQEPSQQRRSWLHRLFFVP
jgi:hypothetical protein